MIRYDGLADWYDGYNAAAAAANGERIGSLLGAGSGRCLDIGCGTGQYFDVIRATGRSVIGTDRSGDQLRIAARHPVPLVQADAAELPFRDAVFDTVTAFWISTDVDDFGAVIAEASRVLKPGGTLLYYGVHPCFNGPHTQVVDGGARVLHPIYRAARWHLDAPWWGSNIRRRVGMRHHTLADLFDAFLAAGLIVRRVDEPGDEPIPWALSITLSTVDQGLLPGKSGKN